MADVLPVVGIYAYDAQEPNVAENAIDGDLSTRWSYYGDTKITFDLGEVYKLSDIAIAWFKGDERYGTFTV